MAKKINVEGIAVCEGVSRNGIRYNAEELNYFAPTLTGKPILKDHKNETDSIIGKVTEGKSIDNGKKVRFKGWVKEDGSGITERILDGRVSEVSIGATADKLLKESEDSSEVVAVGLHALELSTTPVPGVIGTSVSPSESFNENEIKGMIESFNLKNNIHSSVKEVHDLKNCKEVKMESTEINKSVVAENKIDESLVLKAKLAEAEKQISDMKEAQRQSSIAEYLKLCEEKKVKSVDVVNASMETLKVLIEMTKNIQIAEKEKAKVEEKIVAVPKSVEVKETQKLSTDLSDKYVIEHSEFGGYAFYKL